MHSESEDHRGQRIARTVRLYVIGLAAGALTQALIVPLGAALLVRVLPMDTSYLYLVNVRRVSPDAGTALMWGPQLLYLGGWAFVAGLLYGRWATVPRIRAGLAVGIGGASVWVAAMSPYAGPDSSMELLMLWVIACIAGGTAGGALASIKARSD